MKKKIMLIAMLCSLFYLNAFEGKKYIGKIKAVMDGDTVKVEFLGDIPKGCNRTQRIRLIGVNTPEIKGKDGKPEYYALQAKEYTDRYWKKEAEIIIDKDANYKDKYGRLLAYVIIKDDKVFLNYELLINGYGEFMDGFKFNKNMMELFRHAEEQAKKTMSGKWGIRKEEYANE